MLDLLSMRNDTHRFLVGEMRVGEMRLGHMIIYVTHKYYEVCTFTCYSRWMVNTIFCLPRTVIVMWMKLCVVCKYQNIITLPKEMYQHWSVQYINVDQSVLLLMPATFPLLSIRMECTMNLSVVSCSFISINGG